MNTSNIVEMFSATKSCSQDSSYPPEDEESLHNPAVLMDKLLSGELDDDDKFRATISKMFGDGSNKKRQRLMSNEEDDDHNQDDSLFGWYEVPFGVSSGSTDDIDNHHEEGCDKSSFDSNIDSNNNEMKNDLWIGCCELESSKFKKYSVEEELLYDGSQ